MNTRIEAELKAWSDANAHARREYIDHPTAVVACKPEHRCWWRQAQRVARAQNEKEKRA